MPAPTSTTVSFRRPGTAAGEAPSVSSFLSSYLLLLPLQERRDVGQHGGQLLPLAKGPPRVQVAARGVGAFREGIPVKVVRRERSGGWVGVLAAEEGGEAVGGGAGGERGGAGAGEEEVELGVARLALVEAALVHGGEQIAI